MATQPPPCKPTHVLPKSHLSPPTNPCTASTWRNSCVNLFGWCKKVSMQPCCSRADAGLPICAPASTLGSSRRYDVALAQWAVQDCTVSLANTPLRTQPTLKLVQDVELSYLPLVSPRISQIHPIYWLSYVNLLDRVRSWVFCFLKGKFFWFASPAVTSHVQLSTSCPQ